MMMYIGILFLLKITVVTSFSPRPLARRDVVVASSGGGGRGCSGLRQGRNPYMTLHDPHDDDEGLMPCEVRRHDRWNDHMVDPRQRASFQPHHYGSRGEDLGPRRHHHHHQHPDQNQQQQHAASSYMHVQDDDEYDSFLDDDDDEERGPRVGIPGDMVNGKVVYADRVGFDHFTPDYSAGFDAFGSVAGAYSDTGVPCAPPVGMFREEKQFHVVPEQQQRQEEPQQQHEELPQSFVPQAKIPAFTESVRQESSSSATQRPEPPSVGMFLDEQTGGPAIFEEGPPPAFFQQEPPMEDVFQQSPPPEEAAPSVDYGDDRNEPFPDSAFNRVESAQQQHSAVHESADAHMAVVPDASTPTAPPAESMGPPFPMAEEAHANTPEQQQHQAFTEPASSSVPEESSSPPPLRTSGPPPMGMFMQEEKHWNLFQQAAAPQARETTTAVQQQPRLSGPPEVGMFREENNSGREGSTSFEGLTP